MLLVGNRATLLALKSVDLFGQNSLEFQNTQDAKDSFMWAEI